MAETKTQRSTAAKAKAKTSATPRRSAAANRSKTAVDGAVQLSEEVAQSVEDGQRAAIEAVRKFVDTVDQALPALPHGDGPTRRREIVDSALEMADRLVHVQYDFIRKAVDSASRSLGDRGDAK